MARVKPLLCLTLLLLLMSSSYSFAAMGLSNIEMLGKHLFQDRNLSLHKNQSCSSCHHPMAGFADPANTADPYDSVVSTGSDGVSKGGRNAPTAAYAGFSPVLGWDDTEGLYVGGLFWDGRATGHTRLADPLAEQAQGPFLNPLEMAMPNKAAVVNVVKKSCYASLFKQVFGTNSLNNVDTAYDNIAKAIAAYERSKDLSRFSSKFDQFWMECKNRGIDVSLIGLPLPPGIPQGILNAQQLEGLALFNTKGNCSACHLTTGEPGGIPPMLTDFTYDNVGIPKNPLLLDNPTDYGLGGFLKKDYLSGSPLFGDANYADQNGKHKVPSLRNVAITAPYGHNGYFPTLKDIVDFYNTRDVAGWPDAEAPQNMNVDELGNLGLTESEVDAIVAFMLTLTDGGGCCGGGGGGMGGGGCGM
ncbi:c-type cytochrome [Candidatus Poribacteria bacterium]|nr:c-type cytochrome [Candidatus Poribacteria bacterium]